MGFRKTIIHTEGRLVFDLNQKLWAAAQCHISKIYLKIPPRHNGIIPITIKGHNLKAPMGYFISNQHVNRILDPNIHVIDGIFNNSGRSTLHILVATLYKTNHVTFNKGKCIGYIEPSINHILQTSINSITTQKNDR